MTREEIIALAKEAGLPYLPTHNSALVRIVTKAVLIERESCALIANATVCDTHIPTGVKIYGSRAATAIRQRGAA